MSPPLYSRPSPASPLGSAGLFLSIGPSPPDPVLDDVIKMMMIVVQIMMMMMTWMIMRRLMMMMKGHDNDEDHDDVIMKWVATDGAAVSPASTFHEAFSPQEGRV